MAELPPPLPPDEQRLNDAIVEAVFAALKAGLPSARALELARITLTGLARELEAMKS